MINLLYIDLFCGAGGTSTGVEIATVNGAKCAKVIACINHDSNAIKSHKANHKNVLHFTEDIRTLKLDRLIQHVNQMKALYPDALLVLWASLECTNFSKAKGGQSRDADSRTLAEHLFRYIEALKPDYIQIENVEEFMSWGDIDENGKPISKDKGRSYLKWIDRVQYGYGIHKDKMHPNDYDKWYLINRNNGSLKKQYNFDYRILNSADFGAYTSRKRFFGQFVKGNLPLTWPEPTHSKIGGSTGLFGYQKKWKAVRDVLNLEDEGKSVFERKTPLSDKTLERIYAGLIKFVAGGKDKWLLKYNSTNGKTAKHVPPGIDQPSPVISCQDRLGLVSAKFLAQYYSGRPAGKVHDIEKPAQTITTFGGPAMISAKFLSAYYGNGDNVSDIDNPSPTVTTKDRLALVSCDKFMSSQYTNGFNTDLESPNPTITAIPKQNLVTVKPWIMDTGFNNVGSSIDEPSKVITANRKWHYLMNPQFQSPGGDIEKPCFTLIAKMDKRPPYLVVSETGDVSIEVYETESPITQKIKEFMALYGIMDIKMRMLHIDELLKIMGFPANYTLIGTQAEQKKYIGNAVEVTTSRAICEATALVLNNICKIA